MSRTPGGRREGSSTAAPVNSAPPGPFRGLGARDDRIPNTQDNAAKRIAELTAENADLRRRLAEREELDAGVREYYDRFQAVLDGAPMGIAILDLAGRHLLVNRRWLELAQVAEERVLGRTAAELFPPTMAEPLREAARDVITRGEPVELEQTVDAEGRSATLRVVLFPLRDAAGDVQGLCTFTTDISHWRRAAAAARVAEQDAAKLATAHQMIATLHHEINNPLQGVLGFAEYLDGKVDEQHEFAGAIKKIFRGAIKIEALMRKLETLARVKTTTYLGDAKMLDLDESTAAADGPDRTPA